MATIRYNQYGTIYSCWSSTDRVTTPSLCFNDGGTTKYVPLFAVGNGSEGQSGDFYFRVGGLCASYGGTTYRAAVERRYARTVESSVSCYISHSGATGSTTQTVQQAHSVTKGPWYITTDNFGFNYATSYVTVDFGVTFVSPPSISVETTWFRVDTVTTTSCRLYPSAYALQWYTAMSVQGVAIQASIALAQTGTHVTASGNINVQQTVTTYPSEYREAWATGDFGYGVTYPSPPSLWLNWGDVSIWNNSGNGSFHAQCLLGGTVAYGQGTTLSRSFSVGFSGAIQALYMIYMVQNLEQYSSRRG